jgi:D-3-phosphoglycerate dehydrogenase
MTLIKFNALQRWPELKLTHTREKFHDRCDAEYFSAEINTINHNKINMQSTTTTSFPKNKIKVLLLENINQSGIDNISRETFQITSKKGSLSRDELLQIIGDYHLVGIRSKTVLDAEVLAKATKLKAIGCFCIGTDQVDLEYAQKRGIPVFNSPFANTRSVAELVISEIIALSRRLCDNSSNLHKGLWEKSDRGCNEVRGKTVGIIGYGHVGSQVSLLAESLSMNVQYYDVVSVLPLGNAKPCATLDELLSTSDYVTIHVPKDDSTNKMITKRELELMKKGSYFLNLARGSVFDIDALAEKLRDGHLAGAAVDVYPSEPKENGHGFVSVLQGCPNTILTPHVGGSTLEAQQNIAADVSVKLIQYMNKGTTIGSVNFPQILPVYYPGHHRILNVHKNVPGVLKHINSILANFNVAAQQLGTTKDIGYMIIEVDSEVSRELHDQIKQLEYTIQSRVLY